MARRRRPRDAEEPIRFSPEWITQRYKRLGLLGLACVLGVAVVVAIGTGVLSFIHDRARDTAAEIVGGSVDTEATSAGPIVTVIDSGKLPMDFGGWIIPGKTFNELGPVKTLPQNDLDGWAKWENEVGAVRAEEMYLRLSLQGSSTKSVLVTRLDIEVVARRQPLAGLLLASPTGGEVNTRHFAVDLDSPAGATVQAYVPSNQDLPTPVDFPYKVSESDLEYFFILVRTKTCDCEFVGVLHWVSDGKQGRTKIDNNGRPFRLTSSDGRTSWFDTSGCRRDRNECP